MSKLNIIPKSALTTIKTLPELLSVNNVKYISTKEELKEYFDVSIITHDDCPLVTAMKNTIIIFDQKDFLATYLIDVFNSFIEENIKHFEKYDNEGHCEYLPIAQPEFEFVYCDDIVLRTEILNQPIYKQLKCAEERKVFETMPDDVMFEFEKINLQPTIMFIDPKVGSINVIVESLSPITISDLKLAVFQQWFKR